MKKLIFLLLIFSISIALPVYAQRPDAPTYALPSEYGVGTREFQIEDTDRPLDVAIWYPTADESEEQAEYLVGLFAANGNAIRDAAPFLDDGPYPVIIFSHGSGGTRYQLYSYLEHLASYGFVVMTLDHPGNTVLELLGDEDVFAENILQSFALRPFDVLRTIQFAESLNTAGDLSGLFDLEKIGVTGHSLGGYTALSVAGGQLDFRRAAEICAASTSENNFCKSVVTNADVIAEWRDLPATPEGAFPPTTDKRIKSVVLLAPATGFAINPDSVAGVTAPTLIIVGSVDQTTPPETNAFATFEQLTVTPRGLLTLENAGHYIFLEDCPPIAISFGLYDSCSDKVWDMQRAHDISYHAATAFFLATLKGDETALVALREIEFIGVENQFIED